MSFEVNFDGLVGPTHNYAGLSPGNVASMRHGGLAANPREAALQGLAKMRKLHDLGLPQAFLPPLERPSIATLRGFGFAGTEAEILQTARQQAPELLRTACSASAMWTANAATVTPATDSRDGRVHFTPANLVSNLHRSLEPAETSAILKRIFPEGPFFAHHAPLGGGISLGDEGAANHTRFCPDHSTAGLHLFVFGFSAFETALPRPTRYPARQSLEASRCVARLNQLNPEHCVFLQQNPDAIDAGVFHNDVIATGNENVLFYHDTAYLDGEAAVARLREKYEAFSGRALTAIKVPSARVAIGDAVRSYLFNSQIVTLPDGRMTLIAPDECQEIPAVESFISEMLADSSHRLDEALFFNLRASMSNGGGPACLRLRVVLDEASWAAVPAGVKIDEAKLRVLESWVTRHYRESLTAPDLADPALLTETRTALDELTQILNLPNLYTFQK